MNADLNYEQRETFMKALRFYFEVTLDSMTYGETMTSDEQLNLGKEVMNTHKLILGLCIDPTLNS